MQLLLRAMIPMGSSSGIPGGQTGGTNLSSSGWNRVVEAWVGVSRRTKVEKAESELEEVNLW